MNYIYIIILVVIAMALQRYFIYLQSKNYTQMLIELRQKGDVGLGVAKGAFSGCAVILCSDAGGTVIDSKIMRGFSTFSRFKDLSEILGENIDADTFTRC